MNAAIDVTGLNDLLALCGQGNHAAWQQLIQLYDQPLHTWIAKRLRCKRLFALSVDELAQDVWLGLWLVDGGGLRKFDAGRGTFAAYLRGVARRQIDCALRRLRKQTARRKPLHGPCLVDRRSQDVSVEFAVAELLSTVKPSLRECAQEQLLKPDRGAAAPSTACVRKRKQRLAARLQGCLAGDRDCCSDRRGSRNRTQRPRPSNPSKKVQPPCHSVFCSGPFPSPLPSNISAVFVAWVSAWHSAPTDQI